MYTQAWANVIPWLSQLCLRNPLGPTLASALVELRSATGQLVSHYNLFFFLNTSIQWNIYQASLPLTHQNNNLSSIPCTSPHHLRGNCLKIFSATELVRYEQKKAKRCIILAVGFMKVNPVGSNDYRWQPDVTGGLGNVVESDRLSSSSTTQIHIVFQH